MKPGIKVAVGTAHGQQGMPGAKVRASTNNLVREIREDDDWFFILSKPGERLTVESINPTLPVTVTNHLSVPVSFETVLLDGTVFDDVLKHGRRYHLAYGSKMRITI